ncbi:MAG: integrase arm-type DNA-binding domain-containing protein, partial [Proteobacteria bacterium]|nr:integrase arm-type DNA-binding domain-containing protein [Pseudomonadota bacterium]
MPKKVLTSRTVDAIRADPSGRLEIPDGLVPGLYLVVQPTGVKSWALRSRINGSPVKFTLGRLAVLSLAKARERARAELEKIAAGTDPRDGRRARRTISLPGTVGEMCDRYVDQHLKPNVRRWRAAEGEIDNHIRPRLGALRLDQITRGHVHEMLAEIKPEFPVAANRALQRLRAVFNWAVERDLVPGNPTLGIKKPTREQPVARTLTGDELAAVWKACDKLDSPAREFIRFLILSGQRREEVRLMHSSEISLSKRAWVIPAARFKADRDHLVPLTETMAAML